ncbi:Crp/Fnr family transcriptional regulator [Pedobacter frigoris]|uniref:Crp/Fnr family transcriptional regulator n=1 Tax=Pedobacter frigoris TaxID=2571272 RepID=UPI00292F85C3|nr:cyclic nucleotide-binding domain-containing protein [Pedobacter frigoris]
MINRKIFEKLIKLLRSINPKVPLPEGFDEFLFLRMRGVTMDHKRETFLEHEGDKPGNAYYVVSGLVLVYGYVDGIPFTESIYRENTIVALREFMEHDDATHTVVATKGTLVVRISAEAMDEIYRAWPPMEAFAMLTAMKYLEMKKDRRNSLLALLEEERVLEFYTAFAGLLPPKKSAIKDEDIASYLAMKLKKLRDVRYKLKTGGLLQY